MLNYFVKLTRVFDWTFSISISDRNFHTERKKGSFHKWGTLKIVWWRWQWLCTHDFHFFSLKVDNECVRIKTRLDLVSHERATRNCSWIKSKQICGLKPKPICVFLPYYRIKSGVHSQTICFLLQNRVHSLLNVNSLSTAR